MRVIAGLLAVLLVFGLAGCGKSSEYKAIDRIVEQVRDTISDDMVEQMGEDGLRSMIQMAVESYTRDRDFTPEQSSYLEKSLKRAFGLPGPEE